MPLFNDDASFEIDPSKNYLEELVGEGKKFQTPAELARGKAESDLFISRLLQEKEEMRNELTTRIKYEEFLDKLNSVKPQSNTPQEPPEGERRQDTSALSPEELERFVMSKINQLDVQKTATQNLNIVEDKLRQVYGPNASQKLRQQAQELGMSEDELKNLASRNPKALFKLLGVDEQRPVDRFTTPPNSQISALPQGGKRGKSFYDEIFNKDRDRYFSASVQKEIFETMKTMGIEEYNKS